MSTTTAPFTAEALLAMPEDGKDRWLIAGELRERPMTYRNRFHCNTMTQVAFFLRQWLHTQPRPRGQVLTGEAGVRLARNPDTLVGVDVVYISPDMIALQPPNTTIIDGVPILAVEILSPSDTLESIYEKIGLYLDAGVAVVWTLDPYQQTATVYRAGAEPEFVTATKELCGGPELPGFRVLVKELFE